MPFLVYDVGSNRWALAEWNSAGAISDSFVLLYMDPRLDSANWASLTPHASLADLDSSGVGRYQDDQDAQHGKQLKRGVRVPCIMIFPRLISA